MAEGLRPHHHQEFEYHTIQYLSSHPYANLMFFLQYANLNPYCSPAMRIYRCKM